MVVFVLFVYQSQQTEERENKKDNAGTYWNGTIPATKNADYEGR
jgi:hypothetical protein